LSIYLPALKNEILAIWLAALLHTISMLNSRRHVRNGRSGYLKNEWQSQCRQYLWFKAFTAGNSLFACQLTFCSRHICIKPNENRITYTIFSRFRLRRLGALLSSSVTESVESSTTSQEEAVSCLRHYDQGDDNDHGQLVALSSVESHTAQGIGRHPISTISDGAKPKTMTFLERRSLSDSSVWTTHRTDCSTAFAVAYWSTSLELASRQAAA